MLQRVDACKTLLVGNKGPEVPLLIFIETAAVRFQWMTGISISHHLLLCFGIRK